MQEKLALSKKQSIKKWESELQRGRAPSGLLYRWLRDDMTTLSPTMVIGDKLVTDTPGLLTAHREYWEKIGQAQEGDESILTWISASEKGERLLAQDRGEELLPQDILDAAKALNAQSVAGLDRWPVVALQRMSLSAAHSLATLFARVEETSVWPAGLLAARVIHLPKDASKAHTPAGWRPITVTSTLYRLYGKARLGQVLSAVIPRLHRGVVGGIPGTRFLGKVLALVDSPAAFARG